MTPPFPASKSLIIFGIYNLQPRLNSLRWKSTPKEAQTMIKAVAYARVSSREQEREGYSIPAQRKLLAEYARTGGLHIEREFIDVESAKNPGRKEFGEMLRLLEADNTCRVVLVEKTDRLYRNRTDALAFESLIEKRGVEIHLVKEARVISRD